MSKIKERKWNGNVCFGIDFFGGGKQRFLSSTAVTCFAEVKRVTLMALCCSKEQTGNEICVCVRERVCVSVCASVCVWVCSRDGPLSLLPSYRLSLVPPCSSTDSKQSRGWRHTHTHYHTDTHSNTNTHTHTHTGSYLDKAGTPSFPLVFLLSPILLFKRGAWRLGPYLLSSPIAPGPGTTPTFHFRFISSFFWLILLTKVRLQVFNI